MRSSLRIVLAIALAGASACGLAGPSLTGTRNIVLSNAEGERHVIGTVSFTYAGAGKTAFGLDLNRANVYYVKSDRVRRSPVP